jgi:rSAM/selenodomain-associated transferase 2
MPAPLTVIIPTLNTANTLGPCLGSVYLGVSAGLVHQVIFADSGSTDAIAEIADKTGADIVRCAPGRGIQLATAAKRARSEWLLILHADTVLPADWADVVFAHLNSSQKAGYFHLKFDAAGMAPRLVAGWANLRSRIFGLPYGDQGLLVSQSLYSRVGGYPLIPLMEDVAIARRLRGELMALNATVTTSASRYRRDGWLRRGAGNIVTLLLYFLGKSPADLAKRYR